MADREMKFRVCLAGSRDLPLPKMPRHVVEQLVDAEKVLLRRPRDRRRPTGTFERTVAMMAAALGIEVEWCEPESGGRAQVYLRDLAMVSKADKVVCYFADDMMNGGTSHVVEAAMARGVPVEAIHVSPEGVLTWVGAYDPFKDGP